MNSDAPAAQAPQGIPVVFIAGMGRSGSTLLDRALGQVPGWWSLGEVVHLWSRGVVANERCACGERFHDCATWAAIGDQAYGGWANLDVQRVIDLQRSVDRDRYLVNNVLRGRRSKRLEEYGQILQRLYEATTAVTGSSVLVDSSKHVSTAVVLRAVAGIDLRVVHLIRDSRGVAYSWTKHLGRPETDHADTMARWSPTHTATRYIAYNYLLQGLSWSRTPVYRLRYEDFVLEPHQSLGDIVEFAGLGTTPGLPFVDASTLALSRSHIIGGNPGRFEIGRIELAVDEAWRDSMPPSERRRVTALTWPLLVQHGYEKATVRIGRRIAV